MCTRLDKPEAALESAKRFWIRLGFSTLVLGFCVSNGWIAELERAGLHLVVELWFRGWPGL